DSFDGRGNVAGALVRQVVTVDRRQDCVVESHRGDGPGDVLRLVRIEITGLAFIHGAEVAAACADVAHQHERRRAMTPTFANVWALGFFANGVEIEAPLGVPESRVAVAAGCTRANPRRDAWARYQQIRRQGSLSLCGRGRCRSL